ncbi:MAG: sulfatase-like hydrolase/transferase [Thermoanaerobaculia bacterium]
MSAALAVLAVACSGPESAPPAGRSAAIVLVTIDTLRADRLPAYGYDAGSTPVLDRLAAESLLFENAWSHAPLTLPSHASILTGTIPPVHGVRSNLGFRLEEGGPRTLAERLGAHGYATGAAVSAYVLRRSVGLDRGFEVYDDALLASGEVTLGEIRRPGVETVDRAVAWLRSVGSRPFFLFVHLFDPHAPYAGPGNVAHRDSYDAGITAADAALGRLLAALTDLGRYDEAMILVTADHGEGLGDHGEAEHGILLHREVMHVPLLLKLPYGEHGGRRITTPVAHVDVAPTLLAAAGATESEMAGASLLQTRSPRPIYAEALYPRLHLGWSELRSITSGRWRLIDGPDPELYDIERDPGERRNLFAAERRAAGVLRRELALIPLALGDPLAVSPEERAGLAALGYLGEFRQAGDGARPDPKQELPWLVRVRAASDRLREGDLPTAERLLGEIVRSRPESSDARILLAATLRRAGRADEAVTQYREAARRAPWLGASVALELAKTELSLGHLVEAKTEAERARTAFRSEAEVVLGEIALVADDLDAARASVLRARAAATATGPAILLLEARVESRAGRIAEALASVAEIDALAAARGLPPVPTLDAVRGDLLARSGRPEEAEAAFRREIERFPGEFETYARLALLLAERQRFEEIDRVVERGLAASPRPSSFELAARTLELLGNRAGAAAIRERSSAHP